MNDSILNEKKKFPIRFVQDGDGQNGDWKSASFPMVSDITFARNVWNGKKKKKILYK